MIFIVFNPRDSSVTVADTRKPGLINLKASHWGGERVPNAITDRILLNVLYPAVEARDRCRGVKGVRYSLISPDPWLVALGLVMWQGIVEGLSWDAVKLSVGKAFSTMVAGGVAPASSMKKRSKTEFGFVWTQYRDGRKQREMFLGLRRAYESEKKRKHAG